MTHQPPHVTDDISAAAPVMAATPIDAILVLLDVVEYTPQARAVGGPAVQQFDQHVQSELTRRAEKHGFHFIKPIGDAALLWGEQPKGLIDLALDLFKRDPISSAAGMKPRFRMLAHKDFLTFSRDSDEVVVDVHGLEGIVLFRLEKTAHLNRLVVTPHLFGGLRHLLAASNIESKSTELPHELKGLGADSPRQVFVLTPPL